MHKITTVKTINTIEQIRNNRITCGRTEDSPKGLAEKLRFIRFFLGLTQAEMYLKLHPEMSWADQSIINKFESGMSEPTLLEALSYSRLAGTTLTALADDNVDLAAKIWANGH